ncbi:MAG: hypothetical protein EHM28_06345 [Spirochaetaceae bacterium]|nr:MAG: hypothetical protein EHM28_06345 [Spirochaetaceae bacterium]
MFWFSSAYARARNARAEIRGCFLPLPPLAEQKRIVAKIDQLMALCDRLESRITAAGEKQTAILNAVMARV